LRIICSVVCQSTQASVTEQPYLSCERSLGNRLIALDEVRLDHHSDQRPVAETDLVDHVGHHQRLPFVLLVAVGVRAVDDDVGRQPGLVQGLLGDLHADRVVVRSPVAAAQDQVTITVAARAHDRRAPLAVDAEETVRSRRRDDGVDGNADVATGAVLEADRGRQAGGYLAVRLRLGGAGADCRP
jgi:hypothetical protein